MRSDYDARLNLSETDRAYMAGLIDGEGYVGVTSVERAGALQYRSDLRLEMTDSLAMRWVADTFGGPLGHHQVGGVSKPT